MSFDGRISVDNSNEMRERLGAALKVMPKALTVDLSRVTSIDMSGLATLVEATRMARRQGYTAGDDRTSRAASVSARSRAPGPTIRHSSGAAKRMNLLEDIGGGVIQQFAYVGGLTDQFWLGIRALPRVMPILGKRGRWQAAIRQMTAIGVAALPMIAIMAACAGMILAMQGAAELRRLERCAM